MVAAEGLSQLLGPDRGIAKVCLGGNRFGSELDELASFEQLDRFVERGGRFVDTALVYADWVPGVETSCSEKTIGRWLGTAGCPPGLVVATKGGHPPLAGPLRHRLDRRSLREDVERSVSHLGLAPIPLYYLHRDDPGTAVSAIVDVLEELTVEGLIEAYGACNWSAERLAAALSYADERGVPGFVANQVSWSVAAPISSGLGVGLVSMDAALVDLHRRRRLPVVAYSAQAKGYFDKVAAGVPLGQSEVYDSPASRVAATKLSGLAEAWGVAPTALALAAMSTTDLAVTPIIGPRSVKQLDASMDAVDLELPAHVSEDLCRLLLASVES